MIHISFKKRFPLLPVVFSCSLIFCFSVVKAQTPLLKLFAQEKVFPAELNRHVAKGAVYAINENTLTQLFNSKPAGLTLQFQFENKDWFIELKESDLFSKGFFVTTASKDPFNYKQNEALHYKGKIKGRPNTFAAVSFLRNEVIAVIADEKGNINIGALNSPLARVEKEHIIYRESDLTKTQPFECGAANIPATNQSPLPQFGMPAINAAVINTEPVDIYFEADNRCYQNNGSNVTNTINWATALFNIVTTLYENDSIYTRMSAIKVWDVADPYTSLTTTSAVLNAFSSNMNAGFPGDLAHLLSQRSLGGGIAWINVLCSSPYFRTGVSANLNNSITPFPAYSWNAMVITHETGHNLASRHTQWCGWPGGAIDNCYAVEGTCPQGPAPINGGTIMSYCHLTGYGINLANGFGPLPGAAIRNAVRNSTCIYPRISFSSNYQSVTEETADSAGNCLNYKLINLKLAVNYTPAQPAIISLLATALASPGLAIGLNKDVAVSPMSFTLSDTTPQIIQLKIYDDAIIENKESLKLDYTISPNGTNAVKNGTYQLDILSLDHRPDSTVNQLLFYESFDSISTGLGAWAQTVLYGAASPNRWVIGNSTDTLFTTNAAYASFNGTSAGYAGSSISDSAIIRLESPLINATGFSNMRLSYLYKCNGEGSGGQVSGGGSGTDFGKVFYSPDNGANWILLRDNIFGRNFKTTDEITLPAAADNSPFLKIAFVWLNNSSIVNNPSFIIDSIVIKGTGSSPIQSATHAANTAEAWLGPNQTVHFYNPVTNNIMATIANKSSHDFGCTRVEMLRSGNSASAAWGDYAAQKVTDKSYKVTASNNNPAAPYEISLYYTNDEINGWKTATGNSAGEMAIVKTSSDITQAPPATAPEFSNYNSISNYGGTPHKVITAAFTGFSTFSIGKAGITAICPGTTQQLSANETGLSYQWQVNTGSGYTNISNNAVYSGSTSSALLLTNAPVGWYGYQYRCFITNGQGTHYSMEYTLKFAVNWMGGNSNAWENAGNWDCGNLPNAGTDVFIKGGTNFYPVVNTNTAVRSLILKNGATVNVQNAVKFTIMH